MLLKNFIKSSLSDLIESGVDGTIHFNIAINELGEVGRGDSVVSFSVLVNSPTSTDEIK